MNAIHKLFYLFLIGIFSFANAPLAGGCGCEKDKEKISKPTDSLRGNVSLMQKTSPDCQGMDIIIICSSTPSLSDFWENRLLDTCPYLLPAKTLVICVDEDWHNSQGAGNGMGTLYAYQKARDKALDLYGIDIVKKQALGSSIAMYHTAGLGKRLAPLTVSERGIKSAVKLPGLIHRLSQGPNEVQLMTLLEAALKQTAVYASSRKGRLSVFWSDQVFIPSAPCLYTPKSHIDILVKKIPALSDTVWTEQNLGSYGLAIWNESKEAKLLDKCSYSTFLEIFNQNPSPQDIGISMGAFSLSLPMTLALLEEFEQELQEKNLLLDSDPCFWMPLTLDFDTYFLAMQARKTSEEFIRSHYMRMQHFKKKFEEGHHESHFGLFQAVDIGSESYWWDYGTVESYYRNNIKMTQEGTEGELMRLFYNIPHVVEDSIDSVEIQNSTILGCSLNRGKIRNSLVIGVQAENLDLENCIMIGSKAKSCTAKNSLLYKIKEDNPLILEPLHVRADFFLPHLQHNKALTAPLHSDGKVNWKIRLDPNPYSWEEAVQIVSNPEFLLCQ